MERTHRISRRQALWVGGLAALLAIGWFGRDSLWRVAQAASSEMARLAAECRQP